MLYIFTEKEKHIRMITVVSSYSEIMNGFDCLLTVVLSQLPTI